MNEPARSTPDDLRRLRYARAVAHAEVAAAREVYEEARRAAFKREIALSVRCVSPFLLTLFLGDQLDLAEVIRRIEPTAYWPWQSRADRFEDHRLRNRHALRYASNAALLGRPHANTGTYSGIRVPLDGGGLAHVRIVRHSVEVHLTLPDLVIESRFGELRITTSTLLPLAVAAGAVGRLLDEIVCHPASDGWGWRVRSVKTSPSTTVLFVPTGVVPWRLP